MDLAVLCSKHPDEALAWAVAASNAEDPVVRAGGIQRLGVFGSGAVAHRSLVAAGQSDPHAVLRIAANSVAGVVVEPRPPDPMLQAAAREAVKGTRFAPEDD